MWISRKEWDDTQMRLKVLEDWLDEFKRALAAKAQQVEPAKPNQSAMPDAPRTRWQRDKQRIEKFLRERAAQPVTAAQELAKQRTEEKQNAVQSVG